MRKFLLLYHKKILIFFLFIVGCIYALISVINHNHFQTFGWDLGYFDQLIWKISKGIYPYSDLSKVNILAGHFSPILFLFAPPYWIWSDIRLLLIIQSFLVVFAAWPMYLVSYEKTKRRLFSYSVVFAYLFFLGTQWSILNEFHELTVAPFLIGLVYYALEKKRIILFWAGIIGLLCVKEELAFLVGAFGLLMFFHYKKRKLGIILTVFSLAFFFLVTSWFMPFISEKGVYQHQHLSSVAKTPSEFVWKMFFDPQFVINSMFTPIEKIHTLFWSLLSFGFLPILAPLGILLPLIEQFLVRFLYTGPQYTFWQNVNHHAAPSAILLAIACIYAAFRINLKIKNKKIYLIFSLILIISTLFQDITLKAPIHSIFKKQFYETLPWMRDNNLIIQKMNDISVSEPIATQNSLFPHFSQRKNIYLLPEINNAKYIIVDLHDGPNKYAPLSRMEMIAFIEKLTQEKQFTIISKYGEAMIMERKLK